MDHHGYEFVIWCLLEFYKLSIWPVALMFVAWRYKEQVKEAIVTVTRKIGQLIEIRLLGVKVIFKEPVKLAKWKVEEHESVKLSGIDIDDASPD